MHIPDGYLSPAACGFFYTVMLPIWAIASKIVKKTLKARQVPMLAIGAAFSFVIMMFNIPIPGGTSGHAIGAVLVAILLGPWASCVAITVALVILALLFGDGGLTTLGANCFNMAFVMPFAGYYLYKGISRNSPLDSKRRVIAAAVAGYLAMNLAALFAGLELGLEPWLSRSSGAGSSYFPYGLKVSLLAMEGEHLFIFGWAEALISGLVVKYLQKQFPHLLER